MKNIIFKDGENNGYDDSDFYYLGVNIETGLFFKHVYASTRWGGSNPLEDSIKIGDVTDETLKNEYAEMFDLAVRNKAIEKMNSHTYVAQIGDKIKVSNQRAKLKNVEFIVTDVVEVKWNGRVTHYNVTDGNYSTNINNVTVIEFAEENIQEMINGVLSGLLRYS